jgi:hypothetical protein
LREEGRKVSFMADVRVLDVLKKARERISDFNRWTVEATARNEKGGIINEHYETAVCWCALGAITREAYLKGESVGYSLYSLAVNELRRVAAPHFIPKFNDELGHTVEGHQRVLKLFDEAIANVEAQLLKCI